MITFVLLQVGKVLYNGHISVPWPSVVFSGIVVGIWILSYGYLTKALIISFGISSIVYFSQNRGAIKTTFSIFTLSLIIVSLYSLIVTFTPISGFEINGLLYTGYKNPVDRFHHPRILQNSFGFYGGRGIYVLISIAFVFSATLAMRESSKLHLLGSIILSTQLINIWWLTGSGRAGLLLPAFLLVILFTNWAGAEDLIPVIVFSPLIFWIIIYIAHFYINIATFIDILDNITSYRLSIYFESIEVIINNRRSLIGWGPAPWGEYSLIDLGAEPRSRVHGPELTRPHNTIFEFIIQYGIAAGSLLIYICWQMVYIAAKEAENPTSAIYLSLAVVLAGTIFVGLAVGGKTGPYSINNEAMIIWWLGLGAIVSEYVS